MELKTHEDLTIAENETVVKSWTYATGDSSAKSSHRLIVTDKRVIAIDYKYNSSGSIIERNEIKNAEIAGFSCSAGKSNRIKAGIACIVFGILCFIGFIVGIASDESILPVFAFICALVLLCVGVTLLRSRSYSLVVSISTKTKVDTAFSILANKLSKSKNEFSNIDVKVDINAAEEIVSVLGAILLTDK